MIDNKLQFYQTYDGYYTQAQAGNIPNDALVFVKDTQEIITHGTVFTSFAKDLEVNFTAVKDSSSTDENIIVKLIASCDTNATITIKRGSQTIITENNVKTLNTTHIFTPDASTQLDRYTAEFRVGSIIKTATINVGVVFVICGENWANAQSINPDVEDSYVKISPAGTYNVNVSKFISASTPGPFHVYFIVPRSMNINGATMSGFEFPLQSGVNSTFQGVDCKYYESSNDYSTGVLTIKIS